jgi:hypothetical protein
MRDRKVAVLGLGSAAKRRAGGDCDTMSIASQYSWDGRKWSRTVSIDSECRHKEQEREHEDFRTAKT